MKKRIFSVALAVLLAVGAVTGLHKLSINSSKTVAVDLVPNIGDPPDR